MNPAATVLDLWEAGLPRTPAARAVLLLEAAGEADAGARCVGDAHRALLAAYCGPGQEVEALADCPVCGAVLYLGLDPAALPGPAAESSVTVVEDEYAVTARPPTLGDLAALTPTDDPGSLRGQLLARCVASATRGLSPVPVDELPGEVLDRVEAALDEADPAADLRLALSCPDCATAWSASLDPMVFAWSAVETAARRLATDVHTLAHAYGWSEPEILALSSFRRHLYLSAVQP